MFLLTCFLAVSLRGLSFHFKTFWHLYLLLRVNIKKIRFIENMDCSCVQPCRNLKTDFSTTILIFDYLSKRTTKGTSLTVFWIIIPWQFAYSALSVQGSFRGVRLYISPPILTRGPMVL